MRAAVLLAVVLGTPALSGQKVFTELREPQAVRAFQQVSEGLVCQCGCNLVLSTCAHVDCPFAIPARRFIEDQIRGGVPPAQILRGFEHGFGEDIRRHPRVQNFAATGRDDLVRGLVFGFGSKVSAHTSPAIPVLYVVGFTLAGVLLFGLWRRRRSRAARKTATGGMAPGASAADKNQPDVDGDRPPQLARALDRLKDLDK